MPLIRTVQTAFRAARQLAARHFWRHYWVSVDGEPKRRVCMVCDRCDEADYDDWGPVWNTTRKGVEARHYPRGAA